MCTKMKLAFSCHLLASLIILSFGVIYLFRSEFMPYHAVAVGQEWSQLPASFQILIKALMKVTGGGWLASALAMLVLLVFPFKEGARWAYWAIPFIGLVSILPTLYAAILVAQSTPASPPWKVALIVAILLVVGLILSLISSSKESNKGN